MIQKKKHPEYKILARLLEMASDEFSNHGCNDFEIPNTPENNELVKQAYLWSSGEIEEFEEDEEDKDTITTYDWILMSYFAHLFEEMAKDG